MSTSANIDVTLAGDDLVVRLSSATYLARYPGTSRIHCSSDLRLSFAWCRERQACPLTMSRAEVERYVGWMREVRRFKPATVARRMAVVNNRFAASGPQADGPLTSRPSCTNLDGALRSSPPDSPL